MGLQRKFQRGLWDRSGLRYHGLSFGEFRQTVKRTAAEDRISTKAAHRRAMKADRPRRNEWGPFLRVVLVGILKPSVRQKMRLRTWIALAYGEYVA